MGGEEIPIDTFDGLLRDLLAWDLVVPGEGDDAQSWQLVRGLNSNWESWPLATDHGQLSGPPTWAAGAPTAAAEG